jgi:hypothetical protein
MINDIGDILETTEFVSEKIVYGTGINKNDFLNSLSKKNKEFDYTVSAFMLYKQKCGSGAGAGKWFENVFAEFTNKHVDGWYALKLDLDNSDWCVHDVIVSPNKDVVNSLKEFTRIKERVEKDVRLKDNTELKIEKLHELLNERWGFVIGVSAKTYKNWDLQVTTSNSPREYLENNHNDILDGTFDVESFIKKLGKKTDEYQLILGLNTWQLDKSYRLTNIDLNLLSNIINKVTYRKLQVHTRYYLVDNNGNEVADFKYGGKKANPFQRGMWLVPSSKCRGLNSFEIVMEGSFEFQANATEWGSKLINLFIQNI